MWSFSKIKKLKEELKAATEMTQKLLKIKKGEK